MSTLILSWILATHPSCPPVQMLIGLDVAGKAQCGTWQQLQARSRKGGGPGGVTPQRKALVRPKGRSGAGRGRCAPVNPAGESFQHWAPAIRRVCIHCAPSKRRVGAQ